MSHHARTLRRAALLAMLCLAPSALGAVGFETPPAPDTPSDPEAKVIEVDVESLEPADEADSTPVAPAGSPHSRIRVNDGGFDFLGGQVLRDVLLATGLPMGIDLLDGAGLEVSLELPSGHIVHEGLESCPNIVADEGKKQWRAKIHAAPELSMQLLSPGDVTVRARNHFDEGEPDAGAADAGIEIVIRAPAGQLQVEFLVQAEHVHQSLALDALPCLGIPDGSEQRFTATVIGFELELAATLAADGEGAVVIEELKKLKMTYGDLAYTGWSGLGLFGFIKKSKIDNDLMPNLNCSGLTDGDCLNALVIDGIGGHQAFRQMLRDLADEALAMATGTAAAGVSVDVGASTIDVGLPVANVRTHEDANELIVELAHEVTTTAADACASGLDAAAYDDWIVGDSSADADVFIAHQLVADAIVGLARTGVACVSESLYSESVKVGGAFLEDLEAGVSLRPEGEVLVTDSWDGEQADGLLFARFPFAAQLDSLATASGKPVVGSIEDAVIHVVVALGIDRGAGGRTWLTIEDLFFDRLEGQVVVNAGIHAGRTLHLAHMADAVVNKVLNRLEDHHALSWTILPALVPLDDSYAIAIPVVNHTEERTRVGLNFETTGGPEPSTFDVCFDIASMVTDAAEDLGLCYDSAAVDPSCKDYWQEVFDACMVDHGA